MGGAVLSGATISLVRSTLAHNAAITMAAPFWRSCFLIQSSLYGNYANGYGGAVCAMNEIKASNSTVSENKSLIAGGGLGCCRRCYAAPPYALRE